ncbi:phenylalanine aminomutase (D-beta-phenylalanine forming) [Fluviispira multicolorata]|uniref:Phenylalanine aminomutase (D-beta-phenylalanine forming) n=1 Tax=Fluviispira multicolorata TaxID=2654512 RepID=A0A833JDC6_9BACT|nr:phenylalanine aminomutase (D-beta-phenylalanine forming) [Fluviispira multicolorata]KAB8028122.1 phenylalanine aminomutase (D-beta-phenylalanine forming) [Fluviispira multicolorata]
MLNTVEKVFSLADENISLNTFIKVANDFSFKIFITEHVREKILCSRKLLESFVEEGRVIYGVNTSMGGFVNYLVPIEYAEELQNNLISSVASNVGSYFSDNEVRAIMLARIISLAKGVSAIGLENFMCYVEMFNRNIFPCIPQKGSLGASGDLGPLAFIAQVGVGKWKAKFNGEVLEGKVALEKSGLTPMKLSYKEGLALINGTSGMVGLGVLNWQKAQQLLTVYDFISALTFEGLATKQKPFDTRVHKRKQHKGQYICAENISTILSDSKFIINEKEEEKIIQKQNDGRIKNLGNQIEDAYSLRCTPQILGPINDSLKFIETTLENELNSSSDNPLVIPEENEVFHNGHFHGQYISMAMDFLAINLTTLSNLSDRRIDRFMDKNNSNGLPPFLCKNNHGLRMGLMGGQFMSTSLTAENRSLCVPLSIQTLTSTGDFQDIVSMGLIAARRVKEIFENVCYIISFELLCACQAIDLRGDFEDLASLSKLLFLEVRKIVPALNQDVIITPYIEKIKDLLQNQIFIESLKYNLTNKLVESN